MSRELPAPGAIVAYWEDNALALGVVVGEERGRLRIVTHRARIERLTPARVVVVVERTGVVPTENVDALAAAGRRAVDAASRVAARAQDVDVPLLWQVVLDGVPEGAERPVESAEALAELVLGRGDGESAAAVVRALHVDGLHFQRRPEGFEPRSAQEVEDLTRERVRRAERARHTEEFHAALTHAVRGSGYMATGSEHESRSLDALERYALAGDLAPESDRELAAAALGASALRYDAGPEGAFRLLRLAGRFVSDDENLALRALGIEAPFPEPVEAHAAQVAALGFERRGREDLTELEVVSIDGPQTVEIDDALSAEDLGSDVLRLGVHLADPGALVVPGDPVDVEAESRGLTHYHPDVRVAMLPRAISEEAASLVAGLVRPALSVLAEIDRTGAIVAARIVRSLVRTSARLDYDGVDRTLAAGEGAFAALLERLSEIGARREASRLAHGAIVLDAVEVDVFAREGVPCLERLEPGSAARRAVTEAMVLAGEIAARTCLDARVPAIYRRQAPLADSSGIPRERIVDPVLIRRVRRRMLRAEVGTSPGRHTGLGLDAYAQVTSALRRFQDLATQRQLAALIEGRDPPYGPEAMQRIAGATERAELEARRAERTVNDYWTLRYLAQQEGQEVEAIVVDTEPRPIAQLVETLWEQPVNSLAGIGLGERVRLRIERVNPRAGLVVLRKA
jgi:exoribonuclease-2